MRPREPDRIGLALRRSELAALTVADLGFVAEGVRLSLARSKTVQETAGHIVRVVATGTRPAHRGVRSRRRWRGGVDRLTVPNRPFAVLLPLAHRFEACCISVSAHDLYIGLQAGLWVPFCCLSSMASRCLPTVAIALSISGPSDAGSGIERLVARRRQHLQRYLLGRKPGDDLQRQKRRLNSPV